jgi:hypothetical protein
MSIKRTLQAVATVGLISAMFAASSSSLAYADESADMAQQTLIRVIVSPTVDCFGLAGGSVYQDPAGNYRVSTTYVYASTDPSTCGALR